MSDSAEKIEDSDIVEDAVSPDKEEAEKKAGKPKKSDHSLVEIGGFEIDTKSRLSALDHGEVKAYKAFTKRGGTGYVAYVSEPHLVPRHNKVEVYQNILNANMARLEKHGSVYWPLASQERYVFIYDANLGKKLLEEKEEQALGLKSDIVYERILKPFASILQDLRDRDFVHGSISANNLYNGGSTNLSKIVLGECLATPSGHAQNLIYETIERSMADPISRGAGTRESDMYAFGVTLAVLLRQNDPMSGLDHDEIIRKKVEVGSYAAITGKDRFTGPILELLRGLLHDDPTQRWTIDEVVAWMDGRRLSPKQSIRKVVAPRPIVFGSKKFLYPVMLAMDVERNPGELKKIIEEGELKNWINRALEKPALYEKVEDAITTAKNNGQSGGYEERLASLVSMALDGDAPVRFARMHCFPEGVGSALAEAMVSKKDLNIFADLFVQNIVMSWLKFQTNPNVDIGALVTKFDACRMFVRQKNMGFGLERCLYLLNPEVRCLSEKLKNYYVLGPEDLMFAFEDICQDGKSHSLFIDRHIAAFLSVKDPKIIDSYLPELNSDDHYKKVMANLICFSSIQRRSQLPYFPAIASAFATQLSVVYKRYHDRTIREKLQKSVEKFAQEGDLIKMAALMDNPDVQQKDFQAFKKAMQEYDDLRKESLRLEMKLVDKASFGIATGQEASALIASIIAGVVILFVGFLFLTGQGVF